MQTIGPTGFPLVSSYLERETVPVYAHDGGRMRIKTGETAKVLRDEAIRFAVAGLFIVIDTGFFAANSVKIAEGGYVPLLLAACIYGAMLIWHRGSTLVARRLEQTPVLVSDFLADIKRQNVPRVPGTAVFLTRTGTGAPPVLVWHLRHNRALHERVAVLRVLTESKPRVHWPDLMSVVKEGENFWRVTAHFGFMQRPDIPRLLEEAQQRGCAARLDDVTY